MVRATHPTADRQRRLRRELRRLGMPAMLITDPVNVGYLTGFTGDDSWLLLGAGRGCLLTDSRYESQAAIDCPDVECFVRQGSLVEALAKVAGRKRLRRLGFEPDTVTVSLLGQLRKGLKGVSLKPVPRALAQMRIRKDASELRAIRRAVAVAEAGWAAFRKRIRLGMTEQRLAAEIEYQMRLAGAQGLAFPTIVGIDPTSALPHARPGGRRLRRGSVLLVDFGARMDGYVSDLTRVLFAGRIPPHVRRVYEVVYRAQAAGIAQVGPGAVLKEVDAAARCVIQDAGYGKLFRHGLGHGLGRLVHEPPAMGPRVPQGRLEPGMVVTVEPGIYIKGRFGIRIEDDVLVTQAGRQVLTHLEKDPEAMVL